MRPGDVAGEALAGLVQRPGRSLLTTLGTILGTGALVAVLGLTTTANAQIGRQFNVLTATTVTVVDSGNSAAGSASGSGIDFPANASAKIDRLHGVVNSGVYWGVPLSNPTISAIPAVAQDSSQNVGGGLTVYAADSGLLAAVQPTVKIGTLFNSYYDASAAHVAILGPAASSALGISELAGNPAVFVDGVPFTVVGIISKVERVPEMLLGVIIPRSTALDLYGPPDSANDPAQMIIHTNIGAADQVAAEAPLALRPDDRTAFSVVPPPNPQQLRHAVAGDLSSLFLLLALVCLGIGGINIANTTLVAVLERANEIGLRRAIGARPWHITAQFLAESGVLGLMGGLVGTSTGVLIVLGTAVANHWTAVIDPATVLPAPLVGAVVGLVAGAYPSFRAASVEPAEALRR